MNIIIKKLTAFVTHERDFFENKDEWNVRMVYLFIFFKNIIIIYH